MNLAIYNPQIAIKILSPPDINEERILHYTDEFFLQQPVLKAWLEDDELMEMTVMSMSLNFVINLRKTYR